MQFTTVDIKFLGKIHDVHDSSSHADDTLILADPRGAAIASSVTSVAIRALSRPAAATRRTIGASATALHRLPGSSWRTWRKRWSSPVHALLHHLGVHLPLVSHCSRATAPTVSPAIAVTIPTTVTVTMLRLPLALGRLPLLHQQAHPSDVVLFANQALSDAPEVKVTNAKCRQGVGTKTSSTSPNCSKCCLISSLVSVSSW